LAAKEKKKSPRGSSFHTPGRPRSHPLVNPKQEINHLSQQLLRNEFLWEKKKKKNGNQFEDHLAFPSLSISQASCQIPIW